MKTDELLYHTQKTLTRAMLERSAPSGGLPIAFRSLLLALGDNTIKKNDIFKTVPGSTIVGDTMSKYYVAGDRPLANDLSSMSDEPFPLITAQISTDSSFTSVHETSSFKDKMTGKGVSLRYMVVQLSRLGAEYMKYMDFFPKTYSMSNTEKIPMNIRSHIPAELFRTTVFRTLGRGANTYPLNPSEVFYTMYQMIDEGYDIPVENLRNFKGFDLGDELSTVYMKTEALYSLFNIGISTFIEKMEVELDVYNNKVYFKTLPYKFSGNVYLKRIISAIKRNKHQIGHIHFNPEIEPLTETMRGVAIEFQGVNFTSTDIESMKKTLEVVLAEEMLIPHNHYSNESSITIENEIEKDISIVSKSVRETMITCIENFKDIKEQEYNKEIDEIEIKLAHDIIMEKVTRPYLSKTIQSLMLEPNYIRVEQTKKFIDEKHAEDPNKYPDITLDEVKDYIWAGGDEGNYVLANLNSEGYLLFQSRIKEHLYRLDQLRESLKEENIKNEIKAVYLQLSEIEQLKRKSPALFINSGIPMEYRELMMDMTKLDEKAKETLPMKIHYYPNNTLYKTYGANIPSQYTPNFTIDSNWVTYQNGVFLEAVREENIPELGGAGEFMGLPIANFAIPSNKVGLYITNYGFAGMFMFRGTEGANKLQLMEDEYVTDFIDFTDNFDPMTNDLIKDAKVVLVKDNIVMTTTLSHIMETHWKGGLRGSKDGHFTSIRSMDVYEEDGDLNNMFVWSIKYKSYVTLSYLRTQEGNLNEQYYLYNIVSGNKRAYLNGIHIPIKIVNHLIGTNLKEGQYFEDYKYPLGIEKYITIIKESVESNNPYDLEQLQELINGHLSDLISSGQLIAQYHHKLTPFTFIREIKGR